MATRLQEFIARSDDNLAIFTASEVRELVEIYQQLSESELRFTRVLISNNGKRQRRLERLRRDLKNIARATTVSSAQSMARGALATDVALRRRDSAEELKEREARQTAAGAA